MDEFAINTFANRGDPLPVVAGDAGDDLYDEAEDTAETGTVQKEGRRERLMKGTSNLRDNLRKAQGKGSEAGTSIQDRLLEKLLQQVIPVEERGTSPDDAFLSSPITTERPNFNITTMSNNFRRFNARIGVVFVFQVKVIRLLSWKRWSHTVSFLAVYTFVCLDPSLLAVLPIAVVLLALLIPSFVARHPAAPSTLTASTNSFPYSPTGPPIAPAITVKPVKELSRDFFHNMRDLQNSMEDFSRLHDKVIALLTPRTNFSDEALSSTVFLCLFTTAIFMFIASHLMPWRVIFLIIGWTITFLGHPAVQRQMLATHKSHVEPHEEHAKTWLSTWIANDIILDSEPETREVEIFELQHLCSSGEWESWLFSPSPYDPMSERRLVGQRPSGTRFFEDVKPPKGWEWSEKKWALDLWSREWVEERIITGVEVETEGERWVYDIRYEYESQDDNSFDSGDMEKGHRAKGGGSSISSKKLSKKTTMNSSLNSIVNNSSSVTLGASGNGSSSSTRRAVIPSWEESSDAEGMGRRGEWRRRRWVRMVKRRLLHKSIDDIGIRMS